jgi:hypothetical protein
MANPTADPGALPVSQVLFSRTEAAAVRLGLADRAYTLSHERPIQARLRWLFGFDRPNVLAHPRLEAIRRVAVALQALPEARCDEFRAARRSGVTQAQLDAIAAAAPRALAACED